MPWHYLTDQDVELLQRLLDADRGTPINSLRRSHKQSQDGSSDAAPEVYVVKPEEFIGPISGVDLSVISCPVYRINSEGNLEELEGLEKRIYNYRSTLVPADEYIAVVRDKSGHWFTSV